MFATLAIRLLLRKTSVSGEVMPVQVSWTELPDTDVVRTIDAGGGGGGGGGKAAGSLRTAPLVGASVTEVVLVPSSSVYGCSSWTVTGEVDGLTRTVPPE